MRQLLILSAVFAAHCGYAQILNSDFENWDSVMVHYYEAEMTDSHLVNNPYNGFVSDWNIQHEAGICRTTDAYSGNYAMIVQNWYSYVEGMAEQTVAINQYPTVISGMYRYRSVVPSDNAEAVVVVTNFLGDTVINEKIYFSVQEEWSQFQLTLPTVQSAEAPGSMNLQFKSASGLYSCTGSVMTCNLLYLDALEVGFGTAGTMENHLASKIKMFPNPTENRVELSEEIYGLALRDLNGREVFRDEVPGTSYTFNLPSGIYIAVLQTENGESIQRLEIR